MARKFTRRPYPKTRKRWYFNAQANVPFLGPTKVAFGNQKRSILNIVRKGLEDPQHKLWSKVGTAPPNQTMTHNTLYTLNLTGNIAKGDDESDRTGENIHLDALKYKIHFVSVNGSVSDPNMPKTYRIMIVRHDNDHGAGTDNFVSGLGMTDLFHGNNNACLELTSAKNVSVLFDQLIKITPQMGSTNNDKLVTGFHKFNKTFTYKPDQNYGKFYNYYLVVAGYQAGGTTGVTNVGQVYFHGDLIFKDSK